MGIITVDVASLSGDHNGDGTVDAADYALWRSDPGSYGAAQGYTDWVNNFGAMAGASNSSSLTTAVPEPTSLGLLLFTLGCGLMGSHGLARRRKS
jgi:hypothetical protein